MLKIIFTALSIFVLVFLIMVIDDYIKLIISNSEALKFNLTEEHKAIIIKRRNEYLFISIALCLAFIQITFFNFLMWFKNLFGVPLTPEQAAERKRIIAERKKAKLQDKLNKLQ